jgi:UDPglucose 6-dehydrogenase
LRASRGYGGSCFPKDVKALIALAKSKNYEPKILESVIELNEKQPYRMIELAEKVIGSLEDKKVAILGLAFKPETDDVREAPSLKIIEHLLKSNAKVKVYDPKAMENVRKIFNTRIGYALSKEECVKNADVVFIITEWEEFCDEKFLKSIKVPIIDGIGIIRPERAKQFGMNYFGIGRICE